MIENPSSLKDGIRWISLTQGQQTCIDEQDWPEVRKYRWHANRSYRGGPFYVATKIRDKESGARVTLRLHTLLLPGAETVDHENLNPLNNRRGNLRPASEKEQMRNQSKRRGGTSNYKGVCWHSGAKKWMSQLGHPQQRCYLGLFSDEVEAAKAYDAAAVKFFGVFARLNFPTFL